MSLSTTPIGVNDAIAVKRFSAQLFIDKSREGYYSARMEGRGVDAMTPIQVLTELERDSGDTINYDLNLALRNKPTLGDDKLKGRTEKLRFYTDSLKIEQVRCGVSAGGRMSRKRTLHDLRMVARARMKEWWGRWEDEQTGMYLAGARGIYDEFIEDIGYTGFGGNSFFAPDTNHQLYGGSATAKNNLANTDYLNLLAIDKLLTKARTMGGGTSGTPRVQPIRINGESHHVLQMHPFQAYHLRTSTASNNWLDIQKNAGVRGGKNPIFAGGLGVYNNVILHEHETVPIFDDYGVSANLAAARATFMGRQALVKAYGSPGRGLRMEWAEEVTDFGNEVEIASGCILGIKDSRFNNQRFGSLSLDSYAPDPNG